MVALLDTLTATTGDTLSQSHLPYLLPNPDSQNLWEKECLTSVLWGHTQHFCWNPMAQNCNLPTTIPTFFYGSKSSLYSMWPCILFKTRTLVTRIWGKGEQMLGDKQWSLGALTLQTRANLTSQYLQHVNYAPPCDLPWPMGYQQAWQRQRLSLWVFSSLPYLLRGLTPLWRGSPQCHPGGCDGSRCGKRSPRKLKKDSVLFKVIKCGHVLLHRRDYWNPTLPCTK